MSNPTQFLKKKLQQQITAGLLSTSALLIYSQTHALTMGTQLIDSPDQTIQINNGDTIQATLSPIPDYFIGIYGNYYSDNLTVNLGTGSMILADSDTTDTAVGIYLGGQDSQIHADQLTINASGENAIGILQGSGTVTNLGSNSHITVNKTGLGYGSSAVEIIKSTFKADQLSINTTGSNTIGIYAEDYFDIDLGSGSSIKTEGDGSQGVSLNYMESNFKADALTIETKGTNATAFEIHNGWYIDADIGANSHIKTEASSALSVSGNSTLSFKGTATERNTIVSNADASIAAVYADAGAIIRLENTDITAATALKSSYDGAINGTGQMNITGNIISNHMGIVDLRLDPGSKLTGSVLTARAVPDAESWDPASLDGHTNLSFDHSSWDMTDSSYVSALALNNGMVNFKGAQVGTTLTIEDLNTAQSLTGNGTFNMQVDVANGVSDQLIVTNSSDGNHHIRAQNQGGQASTGTEVINMVQTADGGATFDMPNELEVGGYRYGLKQNGNDWDLYSTGKTSSAEASANFLNVSYLLNYAETQTLLQRMGELRQSENTNGDVWVRAFTGKFDSFDGDKLSGFDMDYNGVQIGADKRLSVAGGDLYLGAMGGTSKADSHYKDGSGDVKGYHFGLYGSYVAKNNFYVDTTLKYSHLKNSFNVADTQYERIKGSAASDGYGLSVEVGKRFYFDPAKSGFYLEPQAQLSYSHQDSASTNASNGLRVDLDSYDSTLGRVSAVAGYEIKNGKNPMNVYVKTGYVTEMSGKTGYSLNGSKESHDFGGNWWENSVGMTAQLNKSHNLYLEGTYSSGSKFNQTQVNAGYRYSF